MSDIITISRSKVYPCPGTNYRVAWKYVYTVVVPGEPYPFDGDSLSWARGLAKRYANGRKIVCTWEP